MSQRRKPGIAAGAICLLLCAFGAFAYADPQLSLADCTTKLNEQPTNHNPAYTDHVVEEPPITVDLEHDFEEQEGVENILTVTNPRDVAVTTKIALNFLLLLLGPAVGKSYSFVHTERVRLSCF
jgi:hypothetical protein